MTTSRQPWFLEGKNLCAADGTKIALFVDSNDAELVLQWHDNQTALEEAQDKLKEVEEILRGEF